MGPGMPQLDSKMFKRSLLGFVTVLLVFVVLHGTRPVSAKAAPQSIVFVGNSYTYGNNLDELTGMLLQKGHDDWQEATAKRHAVGGARFSQHLEQADGTRGDTVLRSYLTGEAHFGVILQEQSQIPGFPQSNAMYTESLQAFLGLNALVEANGAHTLALMTWGRREGDTQNVVRYPDFKTMQGHLKDGYFQYAIQASTEERQVIVVPAGLAFEKVYDDIVAAGQDPLVEPSLFWRLYSGDGSHPSLGGSYLTACVIFASLTGQSPVGVEWAPDGLDETTRTILQEAAAAVVLNVTSEPGAPAFVIPTRDEEEAPGGEVEPEGGSEQSGTGSEEQAPTEDTLEPDSAEEPESSGCRSVSPNAFLLLILLVFLCRRVAIHQA